MNNKKGFTLVELMVVVAIVAILAAVALPMYSTFKQKARASTVLKSLTGASSAFQTHWDDALTFSGDWSVGTGGGSITVDTGSGNYSKLGAGLPAIENLTWDSIEAVDSQITVTWTFSQGCPDCSGSWQMICGGGSGTDDICTTAVEVGSDQDPLGLNKGTVNN